MVNEVKNNSVPWQCTVPQQMPWMSSYQPVTFNMQFGVQQQQQQQSVTPGGRTNGSLPMPTTNESEYIAQQPHPFIPQNFSTATTLTMPVTVCPTTLAFDTSTTSGQTSVPNTNCVTNTTQSYPHYQGAIQTGPATQGIYNHAQPVYGLPYLAPQTNQPSYNSSNSLTHLPEPLSLTSHFDKQHKRRSIEMDDEDIQESEPPTKQFLSERKLFQQFGSLNLDGSMNTMPSFTDTEISEIDEEIKKEHKSVISTKTCDLGREQFNRYVYLLFKDKKDDKKFLPSNQTMDRLAREERDKLSKAVVLWTPPPKNFVENDSDSDDDFKYTDHKDFLKTSSSTSYRDDDDSIIITDVTDIDDNKHFQTVNTVPVELDDEVMLE